MKTFQTILNETGEENVFPSIEGMNEDFKNAVKLWFSLREVSSNNNFVQYFQRILYRDFGQYLQLLRIEPNIAQYDWLVQNYTEAMTETTNSVTGSTSGQTSGTQTNNLANSQTKTGSGSIDTTVTNNLSDATTDSTTTTHGHTVTNIVTDTNQASGTDSHAGSNKSDVKNLQKENPMSVSYANGLNIDGTGGATAQSLDWQYPSNQAESASVSEDSDTTTYGRKDTHSVNGTTTNGGQDTVSGTGSASHTGTVTTDTDTSVSETVQGTNTGTVQNTGSTSGSHTESGTNVVKHIDTGRNVDISTLLENATSFIINSSAFEWMRKRLEPCFMGIYSDDEEIEEGV